MQNNFNILQTENKELQEKLIKNDTIKAADSFKKEDKKISLKNELHNVILKKFASNINNLKEDFFKTKTKTKTEMQSNTITKKLLEDL